MDAAAKAAAMRRRKKSSGRILNANPPAAQQKSGRVLTDQNPELEGDDRSSLAAASMLRDGTEPVHREAPR